MFQGEFAHGGNGFQEVNPNGKPVYDDYEDTSCEEEQSCNGSPEQVTPEDVDDLWACPFIEDIYQYARDCVTDFFKDKSHYSGGQIPMDSLLADDRIQMVINTTISAAAQTAYDGTEKAKWIDKKSPQEGVPGEDVRTLISIFNECSSLNIPKYFAGGIALLCMEFCEGVDVPYHKIEGYLAEEFGEEETWYIEYRDENGNIIEDHDPDEEDLAEAENGDEFCLDDLLIEYGLPK